MTTGNILWFLAIGAAVYFMMKKNGGCCGGHDHGSHYGEDHGNDRAQQGRRDEHTGHHDMQKLEEGDTHEATALKDPCGMEVKEKDASLISKNLGKTFHFCSEQCKKLFNLHPNNYT